MHRTSHIADRLAAFTVCASTVLAQVEALPPPAPKAQEWRKTADWKDDYPVRLDIPKPSPQPVYQRSRRQALERIASNLQGNTRREVWLMATEFFARAPEDAVDVLIGLMDRSFTDPSLHDVVRNALEAMGKMQRVEFDDAIRRAMEHPDLGVRQAACAALATSGLPETVRSLAPLFLSGMDGRSRLVWLRAVRLRLTTEAPKIFQDLLRSNLPPAVRDLCLNEACQLPPTAAVTALEPVWETSTGDLRLTCAGIYHAAGRPSGTVVLLEALLSEDSSRVAKALSSLHDRPLGSLREHVLKLSTHPRPEVRLAVAQTLAGLAGDDVTATYEVLAGMEELVETKSIALRELTLRGKPEAVGQLLEQMATATGSRLELFLRLLVSSGDPRCVDVFRARFEQAPEAEGRQFLLALAMSKAPGAPGALFELFMAKPQVVSRSSDGGALDSRRYIPVILPNLRGHEIELMERFESIPKTDYERRALYLDAIAGIGVERGDPALGKKTAALLRALLVDPSECSQLRVQALNALTRSWLDLDDVRKLTRMQEPKVDGSADPLRSILKDFLFEYF